LHIKSSFSSLVLISIFIIFPNCIHLTEKSKGDRLLFNKNWEFTIESDSATVFSNKDEWKIVDIPHTPVIEPLIVNDQWQGICWYRRAFIVPRKYKGKKLFLRFEGAMNVAEVWVNGVKKIKHLGGYLPFVIDFTEEAKIGQRNEIIIRLNNTDNPITGPKPLHLLDFNMYGGLYRDVFFIVKDKLHITDPIFENLPGSGGIFATIPKVTDSLAVVSIQTHLRNDYPGNKTFSLVHELYFDDSLVFRHQSNPQNIKGEDTFEQINELEIVDPLLWFPNNPNLYFLVTKLEENGILRDIDTTRIGIRRFEITREKFAINGKENFLRGVNRHQEYPHIGYALSNNAQYRDAKKIKDAGFDYVRLSHYPHSPAFMVACDELGLLVLDAIPGWQYFNEDEAFQQQAIKTCRDMIRRDRNHPCVLAWEVSLNESWMPEAFIDKAIQTAREEYPGDQCFTAGWQEYGYDIYLQARQHRIQHYKDPEKPYIVSEYGDWEYYALNAGLNQDAWGDLLEEERSSRQLLSAGEKRLLQQATNIQEAHNDNLNTPAFADGYWVMFDYNRGYADDLEASGIMSIYRLPKFSYYFFQSQRDPDEISPLYESGPMVFIASYWDEESDPNVRVFSNCEEVALYLNDSLIGRKQPDQNRISNNLAHPPFTFSISGFEPGKLLAEGIIAGEVVASHLRNTPGKPVAISLWMDESGRPPQPGVNDAVFIYAALVDSNGTIVPINGEIIEFSIEGNAEILNPEPIKTEAGIGAVLIMIGEKKGQINIEASCLDLKQNEISITLI
jgi:beta-galactosidase